MRGGRFEGDGREHEHRPPGREVRRQGNETTMLEWGGGSYCSVLAMQLWFNSGNARFGDCFL